MNQALLQQLKDIHLPKAVGWWPPAPGWWILAGLVLTGLISIIWLWRRRQQRLQLHRQAVQLLQQIHDDYAASGNTTELAAQLSSLLRRVAISINPETAHLIGEDWLRWLDSQWSRDDFSSGAGRALIELPYRPAAQDYDPEPLLEVIRNWLQDVTRRSRHD